MLFGKGRTPQAEDGRHAGVPEPSRSVSHTASQEGTTVGRFALAGGWFVFTTSIGTPLPPEDANPELRTLLEGRQAPEAPLP